MFGLLSVAGVGGEGAAVDCGGRSVRLLAHTGADEEAERRIRVLKMNFLRPGKNCVGNLMRTTFNLKTTFDSMVVFLTILIP